MVKIEKPLSAECDRFHNLRATMKQNRGLWENMACMISTGWSKWRKPIKCCAIVLLLSLKMYFYKMAVKLALLHGAECWAMKM